MSRSGGSAGDGGNLPLGASAAERPALRRGLLGYRRDDVHQALDARDAEVTELRQDVAALWLAFGQHDRMIRAALEQGAVARPAPPATAAEAPVPAPAPPTPVPADLSQAEGEPEPIPTESITRQLSELDDVLAAIETATQSLERSYADEIAPEHTNPPSDEAAPERPASFRKDG